METSHPRAPVDLRVPILAEYDLARYQLRQQNEMTEPCHRIVLHEDVDEMGLTKSKDREEDSGSHSVFDFVYSSLVLWTTKMNSLVEDPETNTPAFIRLSVSFRLCQPIPTMPKNT